MDSPQEIYPETTVFIKNPTMGYTVFEKADGTKIVYLEFNDESSGQSVGIEIPDSMDLTATIVALEDALVDLVTAETHGMKHLIEHNGYEEYNSDTITTEAIEDWK